MAFATLLSIAGCSAGHAPDAPGAAAPGAAAPGAPAPPPPAKTVFDPLVKDEQRARDVQKTVDESAEIQRKAVDNQERGDPPP